MDIATSLLEFGAKSSAESKAGFTPLHLASQEGHTDMASLLLGHQAQVDAKAKVTTDTDISLFLQSTLHPLQVIHFHVLTYLFNSVTETICLPGFTSFPRNDDIHDEEKSRER